MPASSISTSVLDTFVERVGGLYSLPQVAVQVLELMGRPHVDVPTLKECLQHDPALVAKILRVVNSSLFGLSHQVTDLNQALALLGTRPLKLLVLGFSLPKELLSGLESDVLGRYWRRTLVKAVAARELCERVWLIPGDEAFIAGLLQDIGMLALIQDLGHRYTRHVEHALECGSDLAAAEIASFGFDHTQLSARLLTLWRLPESLVRAIAARPDKQQLLGASEGQPLRQALHLAELAAAFLVDGRSVALAELLDAGQAYRELTLEQLTAVLETLDGKVVELADVLSLELVPGESFTSLLAKAQGQLSAALADLAAFDHLERQASQLSEQTRALQDSLDSLARRNEGGALRNPAGGIALAGPVVPAATVAAEVDPGLTGRVSRGIAACRAARASFSLLLVELDRYDDLILTLGAAGAAKLSAALESALCVACETTDVRLALDDGGFAVLLEQRDRPQATALARDVMRRFAARPGGRGTSAAAVVTLSAGLATLALPPKNFPAATLLDAVRRCLNAAQGCGGDSLKSIEL